MSGKFSLRNPLSNLSREIWLGIIRHVLGILSGVLVGNGILTVDDAAQFESLSQLIVGAVFGLAVLRWSIAQKIAAAKRAEAVGAQPSPAPAAPGAPHR